MRVWVANCSCFVGVYEYLRMWLEYLECGFIVALVLLLIAVVLVLIALFFIHLVTWLEYEFEN